jgi:hypothetical protein
MSRRLPKRVPDATYPNMYRIEWPDGRLSDMANLARVNDAIAAHLEERKL